MNTSINVALSTFGTACFVAAGGLFSAGKVLEGVAVGLLGVISYIVYEKMPAAQ